MPGTNRNRSTDCYRVLVIGGYGSFGRRLVKQLLNDAHIKITAAGRNPPDNGEFAVRQLDIFTDDLITVFADYDCIVNATGPFDQQDYSVAEACIAAGVDYIDLADNREFVNNFNALDDYSKAADVLLVSGASTVPGLSAAVVHHYFPNAKELESLDYGISPGNQTERGLSTVASILSNTGKPFATLKNGQWQNVFGWQGLRRHDFAEPMGQRWLSNCNIPDLDLLPKQYPNLKSLRFQAGLELGVMHWGLWFLSWLSRIGLVKNWASQAALLKKISDYFLPFGSDAGGMFMRMAGPDREVEWQLIAENGLGPNVPTIAAVVLIRKLAAGEPMPTGAMPCIGLFTLDEFFDVAHALGIHQQAYGKPVFA